MRSFVCVQSSSEDTYHQDYRPSILHTYQHECLLFFLLHLMSTERTEITQRRPVCPIQPAVCVCMGCRLTMFVIIVNS